MAAESALTMLERMRADGGVIADVDLRQKSGRTIQSVERALDLLEILAEAEGELPLKELASRAGLNNSTCHHLLSTLAGRGYIGQTPSTRNYFLGSRITELSNSRMQQFNLLEIAKPELRRLNEMTLESVHLAVMQGLTLETIGKLESKLPIRVGSDERMKADAAHATATGKAILAWLPEPEIARVIAHGGLRTFTPKTLSTISDLMDDLRLVRRNGYSVDDEEFQPGVICVGAAIRDQSGAVIGAISSSMPSMRAEGDHLDLVRRSVMECAANISTRFGNSDAERQATT